MNYFTDEGADEEVLFERPSYRIRVAGNRGSVGKLLDRMYAWRGYKPETPHQPAPQRVNQLTLEAVSDEQTVGTISVGLDSPARLHADGLFGEEIGRYRQAGARVCEFTKLAISRDFNCEKVLPPLFHLAHIYAHRIHRATDLFVEINPRHAVFYRRLLGFSRVGEQKTCPRVSAPAVLLHLDLNYAAQQLSSCAQGESASGRSFYRNGFSAQEEARVRRKIEAIMLPAPLPAATGLFPFHRGVHAAVHPRAHTPAAHVPHASAEMAFAT